MGKVLTDIMGTTTHTSLIGELLSHFEQHSSAYLAEASPEAIEIIDRIKGEEGFQTKEQVFSHVVQEIKKKNLRPDYLALTGMVNKEGYEQRRLQAPFFEDVPRNLQKWRQNGNGIFVYSNGGAAEQELIFRNTNHGDLTPLVDGYFGTDKFGSKYEPDAYHKISDHLKTAPAEIAFLSDITRELDAADKAGCRVVLVQRPGNKPVDANSYESVKSFDQINI